VSGILSIVRLDGHPVAPQLLSEMTQTMVFRGPDGTSMWSDGQVGLANTALHTTHEAAGDRQPCSLDGDVWITADLRLDGRADLRMKLGASAQCRQGEHGDLQSCTDAELVLHAYATWGPALVEHLLGDFAFVIWDQRERALVCGRDPFGIKPLYYAMVGDALLLSNTLDPLRAYPGVSDELDELAIADFLLFNFNGHLERTAFSDIKKLPPAHTMTWAPGRPLETRRYWDLSVTETTRYRRDQEYVDHFHDLFSVAVADRLRCDRASVLMSGGMDSTSVAWMAAQTLPALDAYTFVYDRLILDDERLYAGKVGEALGIDVHFLSLDEDRPEHFWDPDFAAHDAVSAEPVDLPVTSRVAGLLRHLAAGARVGLTGQGGDPLLHLSRQDFVTHFGRRRLGVALDVMKYWYSQGRLPRVGMRTSVKRRLQGVRRDEMPVYPPWLDPDLERRLALKERWDEELATQMVESPGSGKRSRDFGDRLRPWAHDDLTAPVWATVFESYDPGATRFAAEMRHPFFDLRLVEFLLSVPPLPWLVDKKLLRTAMEGRLPDLVRERAKTPLSGHPAHEQLVQSPQLDLEMIVRASGVERFIDLDVFRKIARQPQKLRPSEYGLITRPLGLSVWLQKTGSSGVHKEHRPQFRRP
jgi:asparagine synthase (glutamine-hydrolysing)